MRDGRTQKYTKDRKSGGVEDLLANNEVRVVVVAGGTVGETFPIDRGRVTLGRGPGVDFVFNDPAMSRQHAAIEYSGDGFRIQDLGSTNGIILNGKHVQAAAIKHGDRFIIGEHGLQFVVEEREATPDTYVLEQ